MSAKRKPTPAPAPATKPATVLLRSTYPCCGGRCTIRVVEDSAKDTITRRCLKCKAVWIVTRTMTRQEGQRVDVLAWDPTTRDGKPWGNPIRRDTLRAS
jgi:hypothetical protein